MGLSVDARLRLGRETVLNLRSSLMARKTLTFFEVRKSLIEQTAKVVGANARFVEAGLEIRKRKGKRNWDANIGIAATTVLSASAQALDKIQNEYDIEW